MNIIAMVRALALFAFAFQRLREAKPFSAKICMERIDDKGGGTFANEITKQVVRVAFSGFRFYFYFGYIYTKGLNIGKQKIKFILVSVNGKNQKEDYSIRICDEVVMHILRNINSNID